MLCYSKENPPINLHCSQHANHPFVLCKNEMMYYVMRAGKDKDTVVSCPICHNEIEFKTKGKSEGEIMKLFEVNQALIKRIYENKDLLSYVQHEEEQFNHGK